MNSNHLLPITSILNSCLIFSASFPIMDACLGFWIRNSIALDNDKQSPTVTRTPFFPVSIKLLGPPQGQSVEMQGIPKDIASISALGTPSKLEERIKPREFLIMKSSSSVFLAPNNKIRLSRPKKYIFYCNDSFSFPSPIIYNL